MQAAITEPSYEELYEDAPCGYLSLAADGTILNANRTLLRSLGHDREQTLHHRRLQDLMAPGSRIYHATHWGPKLDLQGEVHEIPVDLVRADGERLSVLLNAVRHGDVVRASVFDATDRRRYERDLIAARDTEREARRLAEHLARHDPLTQLPNRVLIEERIGRAVVRARRDGTRFVLCLLGLDRFKVVNDSLGHAAGDDLLRAVAERLTSALPDADTIGRLGGDEFAVLLAGDADPEAVAARVHDLFAGERFTLDGISREVRVSVGLAVGDGRALEQDLLRDADIARYRAKEHGRGGAHVVFDASMRERALARLRLEAELRTALANDELRVFYQPVVSAADRRIVSMEALVRWEHPQRGMVPPGEFIPVAEEFGLIGEVGTFVLTEAGSQLARWRREGIAPPSLSVAVNVSARCIERPGFAGSVAAILEQVGLADVPERVGLEVTESLLMESGAAGAAMLEELARLGVGLLLDDFGTGVSSLARLKRLPVDTLKVDRAFITGLGDASGDDDAIVGAVLAMATRLGLRVVAEGVETEQQLATLQRMGCDRIQGFLISRPVPADEMARLLVAGPS